METPTNDIEHKNAMKTVRAKLWFYYHAAVFIVMNLVMLAVNLKYSPQTLWFYWPLLGWSVGLASHGFQVFAVREGSSIRQRMVEKEMAKNNKKT
ncbi:MAG: 2TM domain-containing protein [Desulfatibacillaceae bacterium]|nr:2TM domain-containing protein [Desulfatibacillaceae bacterium]